MKQLRVCLLCRNSILTIGFRTCICRRSLNDRWPNMFMLRDGFMMDELLLSDGPPRPPPSCMLLLRFGDSGPKLALLCWNMPDVGVTWPDKEFDPPTYPGPARLFNVEFAILRGGCWKFKFAITWRDVTQQATRPVMFDNITREKPNKQKEMEDYYHKETWVSAFATSVGLVFVDRAHSLNKI